MEKNILFTLKYFDLFDYPLNFEELVKWLFKHENIKALKHAMPVGRQENKAENKGIWEVEVRERLKRDLDELLVKGEVEESEGYYFLSGRGEIVKTRGEREELSKKKLQKARRVVRWLAMIDGVKMIAVASNLGYLNAGKEADIDLFVVTEAGKIWRVRFWMVLFMKLFNQRPTKNKTKDKICLSYFVTEDNLNLESTKTEEVDVHLIYLLSQYIPIYMEHRFTWIGTQIHTDKEDVWSRFMEENKWINKYLPLFRYDGSEKQYMIGKWQSPFRFTTGDSAGTNGGDRWIKNVFKVLFGWLSERQAKKIQLKILPKHLQEARDRGDKSVIINDRMLKLHSNDKRKLYNRRMEEFVGGRK